MFHETCCLSSQERIHADLFLSLIIDAGSTEISHDTERYTPSVRLPMNQVMVKSQQATSAVASIPFGKASIS
jgi:hypothetical protein